MGRKRQEFAKVEWWFLRWDRRWRALKKQSGDLAVAYIQLWATCVELRRDTFERGELQGELEGSIVPDKVGVKPELMAELVRCCLGCKLLSRGPRGSITVDGVRAKHAGLRGWNAGQTRPLRVESRESENTPPLPPHGGEQFASLANANPRRRIEALRAAVKAGQQVVTVINGIAWRLQLGTVGETTGKLIILPAKAEHQAYAEAVPITRSNVADFEWETTE